MPTHHETRHSNHSPEELFSLVADVGKYPEFLPWCKAARIRDKGEGWLIADLVISFAGFSEKYTSKVHLYPTERIEVELVEGPFSRLTNSWRFEKAENGCEIHFSLDFQFRSRLLEKMIGLVFEKAFKAMVSAFETRADELFGRVG